MSNNETSNTKALETALEIVLNNFTKGEGTKAEATLWAMRMMIEKMGVMRDIPSFLRVNMDGFLVQYGCPDFPEADAKIEAFNMGRVYAGQLCKADK